MAAPPAYGPPPNWSFQPSDRPEPTYVPGIRRPGLGSVADAHLHRQLHAGRATWPLVTFQRRLCPDRPSRLRSNGPAIASGRFRLECRGRVGPAVPELNAGQQRAERHHTPLPLKWPRVCLRLYSPPRAPDPVRPCGPTVCDITFTLHQRPTPERTRRSVPSMPWPLNGSFTVLRRRHLEWWCSAASTPAPPTWVPTTRPLPPRSRLAV